MATLQRLREEHGHMARLLHLFEEELLRLECDQRPDLEFLREVLQYCVSYPELCHHPKEDLVYGMLRQRDPEAAQAFGNLAREHEVLERQALEVLGMVDQLREGHSPSPGAVAREARNLLDFYRRHMAAEEDCLYEAAARSLTEADWAEIDAKVGNREDPIFGDRVEAAFAALRSSILGKRRNSA
ncbi:MAG: hemerythrin domain-containing protein [Rhodospirillales bacterium]|nr:hemerythrin domain-containing protein [Rhodospirillales bacterium]